MKTKALFVAILAVAFTLNAADPIQPDHHKTPGVVFLHVTVEKICTPGYANGSDVANSWHGVRYVPRSVKWVVFRSYFGMVPDKTGNYEIDHLISLELGGSNDPKNLWPESYLTDAYNAHVKDKLENRMHTLVKQCLKQKGHAAATTMLKQFQLEIATNWVAAYHKYVSLTP